MLNLVKITNNQVTTTSKQIADVFGKEHKNILAAINSLDIPEDFRGLNFKPSKYQSQNRNGQTLPCYEITRDGFTLLAMGFTGKKAMEWKIKYINAFNAMEKALTEKSDKPVVVSEHTRALPSGKKEIVLSDKAKTEIGGIVKAVLQAELTKREAVKDVLREVIREEFSSCVLKTVESESDRITADGLPIGNWLVGIVHGANAVGNCFNQMLARQNQAVKLLAK